MINDHKKLSLKWFLLCIAISLFFTTTNTTSNIQPDSINHQTSTVGSLKGNFQVTPTGQAQYSIPIDVPPGTAGVVPNLAITYDSSNSNTRSGFLGSGFSLEGLTAITRCSSNREQNRLIRGVDFTRQDKFCLNGEQLVAIKGEYGANGTEYRTYVDSKVKVISSGYRGSGPASFKVFTKDGRIAEYGATNDSQVKAQGKTNVSLWGVNRIQDRLGNYLDVHYFKDETQGIFYPTEIRYTGNDKVNLIPYNSVKFNYEERPDTKTTYQAGSKISVDKRLKSLQVFQENTLVYEYHFVYEISKNTFHSRLISIQKCSGRDICLPPTKFTWQTNEEGFAESQEFVLPTDATIDGEDEGIRILDIDGDGLPDIVQGSNKSPHSVWLNTGKKWEANNNFVLPINILTDGKENGVRLIDINGDGLIDIVQSTDKEAHRTWINTGERWEDNSTFAMPMDILVNGKDDGVRFVDVNGDGLLDIVQTTPIEETWWQGQQNANHNKFDFVYSLDEAEKSGKFARNPRGWTIVYDVEEAAFIYKGDKIDKSNPTYMVWLNNKKGWTKDINIDVPFITSAVAPNGRGIIFLDINGDGLADLVCGTSIGENKQPNMIAGISTEGTKQQSTWLNIDSVSKLNNKYKSYWISSDFILPTAMLANGRSTGLRFLDLNGDGLPDIIQSYTDNITKIESHAAWINTGASWIESTEFMFSPTIVENGKEMGITITDLNGDGLPDIVQNYVDGNKQHISHAWINDGKKWINAPNFELPNNIVSGVQYLDVNGDGLVDIVQSTIVDGKLIKKTYLNKAEKLPDYLTVVTDGFGDQLTVDYEPLSGKKVKVYTKEHNARYPNIDWNGSMYVVHKTSSKTASSDENDLHTTIYNYTGAKFNNSGLGFLGFHIVTAADQTTGISTTTTYNQDVNLHSKTLPQVIEVRLKDGTVISSTKNAWDCKSFEEVDFNTTYHSPYLAQSTKKTFGLDGKLLSTMVIDNTIDIYGNPKLIESALLEEATKKVYRTSTLNIYNGNSEKWLLGELIASTVTKSLHNDPYFDANFPELSKALVSGNKYAQSVTEQTRTSNFNYDPETSLLKQAVSTPEDKNFSLSTEYERDEYGNVVKTTVSGKNIETRITKTQYDKFGRFVTQVTNPLGHTTTQVTDPRFGTVTESVDENGLKTIYQYDDFSRLIKQVSHDGTIITINYNWFNPENVPIGEVRTALKNCSYVVTSYTQNSTTQNEYYDILGRKVASTTQNMDGKTIWQLVYYDELGRVSKKTQPFFENVTKDKKEEIYFTKIEYDVLGRAIKTTLPDNSTAQIIYDGFTTTTINQLQQKQIKEVNALGELVKSTDNLGSVTSYKYDAYGNMIALIDSKGNTTKIEYDRLGRKIAIHDKDKGNLTYQYDVLGNLISQTDALKNITSFKYDKLNRLVKRTENVDSDQETTSAWEYDTQKFGVGKLAKERSVTDEKGNPTNNPMLINRARASGLEAHLHSYKYDTLSRIIEETTVVKDQSYTKGFVYGQHSRLDTQSYPNGLKVKYIYNELGFLVQITDANTNKIYWKLNAKDAQGHITSESHSNDLITNYTYDPKNGFLTDIDTKLDSYLSVQKKLLPGSTGLTATHQHFDAPTITTITTNIQKENYSYDVLGNIQVHQDLVNNVNEVYQYDALNRLTTANSQGSSLTLQYDALGNIIYKSDVGTYKYGENDAGPHAVTSIIGKQSGTFKYNASGDQTEGILNGVRRAIIYTNYSKPLSIVTPKETINYLYNIDHQKLIRVDEKKASTTIYLGDYEETIILGKAISNQTKTYIGPSTIYVTTNNNAESNSIHIYEALHNNLGSVTDITDENGNVLQHFIYTPFGEQKQIKGEILDYPITHKGFTGHETIEDANLIHMEGRLYDPVLGRFLSADPYIQEPENSQSLNRYSYCINNPLAFVDPTGFGFWSTVGRMFREVGEGFRELGSCIWSGIKTIINSPIGRIAIGVVIGLTLGPGIAFLWGSTAGGLLGLGVGSGAIGAGWGAIGAGMAIAGASTTILGLATGNNLKHSIGEGLVAASIVGVIGQLNEKYRQTHSPTPTENTQKPESVRQGDPGGNVHKGQGDSFSDQTLSDSTKQANPANNRYFQETMPSSVSDRASPGSNYSNGAGTGVQDTTTGKRLLKSYKFDALQVDVYSTATSYKGNSNIEKVFDVTSKKPISIIHKGKVFDVSYGMDGSSTYGTSMLSFGATTDHRYIADASVPVGKESSFGATCYFDPGVFKNNMKYVGNILRQMKPPQFLPIPGIPIPVLP